MWTLLVDGKVLYDPRVADRGYAIEKDASLDVELNKASKLVFTVPARNPVCSRIRKMQSIVELYRKGVLYFRGRVVDDYVGEYNSRKCTCESELAYLNDSTQRPYSFPLDENKTSVEDYFRFLVERHNQEVDPYKRFEVGRVTVTDSNGYVARSDTEYSTTWKLVCDGLLKTLGGYLWVRREGGKNYIDYLKDFDAMSDQPIEFALNLVSIGSDRSGADVASAVIPLGAKDKETGARLTLEDVPDEETEDICKLGDLVYSKAAVARYGWILRPAFFDDVHTTNVLKQRGISTLGNKRSMPSTIRLTAADLSGAGYDVSGFYIGRYTKVRSKPHEGPHSLSSMYLVKRLSLKLFSPSSNTITVGDTSYGFLEQQSQQNSNFRDVIVGVVEDKVDQSSSSIVEELHKYTDSGIEKNNSEIRSYVSDTYYTKDETNGKIKEVGDVASEAVQTANGFELKFSNLEGLAQSNKDGLKQVNKYIRLVDGNIVIGQENDDIELVQTNNRLSFVDKDSRLELAYISDGRFFAPRVTIVETADLGGFRADLKNGLALKWIGG